MKSNCDQRPRYTYSNRGIIKWGFDKSFIFLQNSAPTSLYVGCFRDAGRIERDLLIYANSTNFGVTIETCLKECYVKGYLFAGSQNG